MFHPLQTKIARLRARVRRLAIVYGLGWSLGTGLAVVLMLGLADYLLRLQDPGIRVLASLAVLAVLGWAGYRFLYRVCMVPLGDVDLACRVQRRFPVLADDLASAVEFVKQPSDDFTAGSAALRQEVIARATAEVQALDFREVLRSRPAWHAFLFAMLVGLGAVALAAADPRSSEIALARLVRPLADIPWPQVHHLAIRNPAGRIARGQPFEVEVVDRDGVRLPAEVRIHYRSENPDGTLTHEAEPMRLVRGMMVARRERVMRPFSFRVEGGDDRSMPWQPVDVVEPPAIESLRVKLTPPPYTGWQPEQSDGNIRALVGTRADITAVATKPLSSAMLLLEGGAALAARITEDGNGLSVPASPLPPWTIEKPGSYTFRLIDREGLSGGEDVRWEIHGIPDTPPTASIDEPSADLFVVPRSVVPVRVTAEDNLAIRKIDLEFARSDAAESPPQSLTLYAGPDRAPRASGPPSPAGPADRRTLTYAWKLEGLRLAPGAQVTFRAVATDYKPQAGKSDPRRLTIITPEELAERITSRQAAILAELSRVLEIERRGREQVAALEKRAAEAPKLAQLDVDQLRGAELNQRQVEHTLTSRSEGVPLHIFGLLADLENNRVDQPGVKRQMDSLLAEIQRLSTGDLPAVERELTAAIKTAQAALEAAPAAEPKAESPASSGAGPAVRGPMAAAGKHQDAVIAALERMVDELSRADRFRRFHRDVGQLAGLQKALARRTEEMARRTLTKDLKDLSPQEAADLGAAAREQAEIANRLDGVQQAMDQAATAAPAEDPAAARAVAAGLQHARQRNLSGQMRAAGERIRRNQLGQAMDQQQQIVGNLQELLDILSGRPPRPDVAEGSPQAKSPGPDIRRLQEEINRRTQELDKSSAHGDKSSGEARRQYEALGRDQERLAETLEASAPTPASPIPTDLPRPSPREIKQEPAPPEPRPADAIDRELFAPESKKAPQPVPAAERRGAPTPAAIAAEMREAAGRIRRTDGGPATQALQKRILAELEELFRQASQATSTAASKPARTGEQKAAAGPDKQPKTGQAEAAAKPGSKPNPGQTTSGPKAPGAERGDSRSRMSMLRRVWGDLPGRERNEMLQLQPPEEFLPKYEFLIEEYFRRLAEGQGGRKEAAGSGK